MIRTSSFTPLDVKRVARKELDWWIAHRERGELQRSLAAVQSEIYQRPPELCERHAKSGMDAVLLRDKHVTRGTLSGEDWQRIRGLLEDSWSSLRAVNEH